MGRHRLDPNQETGRVNARVPEQMVRYLKRLGGGGHGAMSLGLRRLFRYRAAVKSGEEAIVLKLSEYVSLAKELERLRKAVAK